MKIKAFTTVLISGFVYLVLSNSAMAHDAKSNQALKKQIATLQKQVKQLQALSQFIKINGSQLTLNAPSITVNAGSVLNLKGAIIKLNNGGKPAARMGSKTAGNKATQTIIDGSRTVLIP